MTAPVSAQIINGDFETGDFTGWTVNDPSDFTNVGSNPALAFSGDYHVNLGAYGMLGSLSQSIPTATGSFYTLTFALANDSTVPQNEFDVYWDGTLVFSLVDSTRSNYTTYSIENLFAANPNSMLEFRYRNDDDFFRLDNVAVNVVPEASTGSFALLGLGLLGLAQYARRRARPIA